MTDPASPTITDPVLELGDEHRATIDEAIARARDEHWAERLFDRDASLWSSDERVRTTISERLGWLDTPGHFARETPALEGFATGAREVGFRSAVVMGMGGSSLAPDVLHRTFGVADSAIDVRILDSTDPDNVARVLDDLDPLTTLFIVASKSGTTTEPLAFQAEVWKRLDDALRERDVDGKPGDYVAAITDPGKSLESIPHHDELREVFLNPPDVGGRYSALTYVGLVSAALIGLDLDALLANAQEMLARCRQPDPARNPGVLLGIVIGTLAHDGRDKLTFIADKEIESFGAWAEQLLAESTGKRGTGIVPVDAEPLGSPGAYGDDRMFVRLALRGSRGGGDADALVDAVAREGHPVIRIEWRDPVDIAGELVRWEVATAIAGAVLGIDPFDQPNVEEAKERTRQLLAAHGKDGRNDARQGSRNGRDGRDGATAGAPLVSERGVSLFGDAPLRLTGEERTLVGELRRHLERRKPNAYLALQAFIAPTPERDEALARIRVLLRDATRRATTSGYGPRFLHSTGQLHKGGPPTGWFLQLTSDHPRDRPIPGWPYTFGQLIDAQAAGDFAVIESHDLPIARVHLGADPDTGLRTLETALREALAKVASAAPTEGR
jgi:transaldolase/glucose-6-phosphate isomerase